METVELIETLEKAIENEENIAKKFLLICAKEKIEELDLNQELQEHSGGYGI